MWETEWAVDGGPTNDAASGSSLISSGSVEAAYLFFWREHCVECAVPECYEECGLYVRRRDGKCARFRGGIRPDPTVRGLYPYGVDIRFRRWAKLQSRLGFGALTPSTHERLAGWDARATTLTTPLARRFEQVLPLKRFSSASTLVRETGFRGLTRRRADGDYDEFLIEVWNRQTQPAGLVVECEQGGLRYRQVLGLEPGHNLHRIPAADLAVDVSRDDGFIRVYPHEDAELHLLFTWLDLVRYRPARVGAASGLSGPRPVKCVVWDLDGTVWPGTLAEDGSDALVLREGVLETIVALDARGILQSVASKNDHDAAWSVLERFGLDQYLLYPAIHWGPKSESVRKIAAALDIGLDSVAIVDDSAFERAEVIETIPEVRAFPATEVSGILQRPGLDLPVTEVSRARRGLYQHEAERRIVSTGYATADEFLATCQLEADLFAPAMSADIDRCLELIQRSNQLNLSTRRYSRAELVDRLSQRDAVGIATRARDRFGDYGLVGFAMIEIDQGTPLLADFVLSCRVVGKRIEEAWCAALLGCLVDHGHTGLQALFRSSSRNGVLRASLVRVGFRPVDQRGDDEILELAGDADLAHSDIVEARIGPTLSALLEDRL